MVTTIGQARTSRVDWPRGRHPGIIRAGWMASCGFFGSTNTMSSQRKRGWPAGQGPRVGRLDSLTAILTEMGAVYREMRYGQTAVSDGTRLIYSLKCMRDVIETLLLQQLDERLTKLEPLPSRPSVPPQRTALQ
jgi:hypothetical protein